MQFIKNLKNKISERLNLIKNAIDKFYWLDEQKVPKEYSTPFIKENYEKEAIKELYDEKVTKDDLDKSDMYYKYFIDLKNQKFDFSLLEQISNRFSGNEKYELLTYKSAKESIRSLKFKYKLENIDLFEKDDEIEIKNIDEFSKRFNGNDISFFNYLGISPKISSSFEDNTSSIDIIKYYYHGINAKIVHEYENMFSIDEIIKFNDNCIEPKTAKHYIPRFNQKEIISLVNSNCSPKFSHEFDSRFDGFDIAFMNDFEIKPIKANKYPQQFKPRQIINFNAQCMEPDDVIKCMNKIDKLNDGYFKFNLKHENIGILLFEVINQNFDINIINNYRKNYYPDDIIELYLQKHYPEKTKLYDKNISSEFLLHSLEQKKDPKTTLNNSIEVNKIINSGGTVTSSPYVEKKDYQKDYIQKKYKINLDNQKSIFLFLDYEKKGLINHIIRDYPESYPIESKLNLYKKGIKPEKCPKFEEFNFLSIHKVEKLIENNIDENELKKLMGLYHATKLEDLIFIKNLNLEKKINIKKLLKLKPAIEQIVKRYKESEDENIKIIGHGASGIIVSSDYLNNKSVSKFSINRKHEYNILRQICHKWKKPRNIISLINIYQIGGAGQTYELLKLHEIDGPNLEEIIQKEKLDYETIISYAADILHGMIEMDLAGVKFHRDIRPANIMLNIKESMLKIIDYGIASCDPNISPRDNRRFGGRNDLDSLGEVIYTMIAKEILFSEFNLKNDSNYANKIKINRDRAFEGKDKKNLKYYYKKIKKNVKYDFFQNFIIDCFKSNDKFELLFKIEKQKKKSKILDWFSKYSPHFTNEDKFTFYMYDINPKRANGYNVEPFDIIRLGSYQVPLTFKNFYSKQYSIYEMLLFKNLRITPKSYKEDNLHRYKDFFTQMANIQTNTFLEPFYRGYKNRLIANSSDGLLLYNNFDFVMRYSKDIDNEKKILSKLVDSKHFLKQIMDFSHVSMYEEYYYFPCELVKGKTLEKTKMNYDIINNIKNKLFSGINDLHSVNYSNYEFSKENIFLTDKGNIILYELSNCKKLNDAYKKNDYNNLNKFVQKLEKEINYN